MVSMLTRSVEDHNLAALVDRQLDTPIQDDIHGLFVHGLADLLVGGRAGSHDQLVQVSVVDGVVVGSALAVVQLVHIGVIGGLPGCGPTSAEPD